MQNVTILVYFLSAVQVIATLIIAWMTIACPSASGPISHLSLLTISPSNSNTPGPTVWMGLYASCSQRTTNEQTFCTTLTFKLKTTYDLSVLPQNAPGFVLESPPPILKIIVNVTLGLSHAFLVLILWMVFRVHYESMSSRFERRFHQVPLVPLLGLFLIAIGLVNFFVLQLYFDMVRDHFNEFVRLQGAKGPNLVASRGQAFLLAYLGYGLAGVSLIVASVDREKRRQEAHVPIATPEVTSTLAQAHRQFDIFTTNQAVKDFVLRVNPRFYPSMPNHSDSKDNYDSSKIVLLNVPLPTDST